jgi:hypothetical protein
LSYSTKRKTKANSTDTKALAIEIDVRGFIPNNVTIDTQDNQMSIRAVRVNGMEKALGIVAPSLKEMEKLKVHPPKRGILLLQYNSSNPTDKEIEASRSISQPTKSRIQQ